MHNRVAELRFSPVSLALGLVGALALAYLGLIAVVMSYAATTIAFSQSVRSDESAVATLESQYLDTIAAVTHTDYRALGYAAPVSIAYVPGTSATALR